MDANLIFASTSAPISLSSGGLETVNKLTPGISGPMSGQEFAGLMRDLMVNVGRQEIAALGADTAPSLATSGLQTMSLGSQISLITPVSPQPNEGSLAEFARSQGLGESAVKALFGELMTNTSGINIEEVRELTDFSNKTWLNSSPVASHLMPKVSQHIESPAATSDSKFSLTDLNNLLLVNQASGSVQVLPVTQTLAALRPTTDVFSVSVGSLNTNAHLNLPTPAATPGLMNPIQLDQTSQATVLLGAALTTTSSLNQASFKNLGFAPTDSSIQEASESPVEMGPLDAMRMRMVPAWETMTRQLAKLNGHETPTKWANLATGTFKTDNMANAFPQAILDLGDTDIGFDLHSDINLQLSSPVSVQSAISEPLRSVQSLIGPTSSNAPALANLEDRSGQIQQLADKLGQALSERLIQQIEKGQWRMHLKLNPGHLGSIEVELDMHNGGLDAIFKTDNSLTRELVAQGMPKLREGLAQSGMAVANVWVNSDSQREPGGNSTPRQNNFNESNVRAETPETPSMASSHKELRSADGWDTLA